MGGTLTVGVDLNVFGDANVGLVTTAGIHASLTGLFDIGQAATRYRHLYLTGDILVDGTVDGVNISDRDHAATHNIDDAVHDTGATGTELDTLTDGSNADALHDHTGGGHTIRDDGADQTQRTGLNFIGPELVVTDDSGGDEQEISILQSAISHDSIGGVSTDDHHAQSHTAASHSDQGATGTELETLTGGSDASSLHGHGNYTDSDFWPVVMHVNATGQANQGEIPFVEIDDTQKTHIMGHLPDSWVSTTSLEVLFYPDATETGTIDYDIASLAPGESAGDNSTTSLNQTKSLTVAELTEWDVTSITPTGAAGDYVFIRIDSDTDKMRVVGAKIVYVRSE